jgi:TatD DNase family protein
MGWVDTHCHLQLDGREPSELLGRAPDVDWVVAPGVDLDSSVQSKELAEEYPGRVFATAGLHPHHAGSWARDGGRLADLASHVSAIGETGLDYYRNLSSREDQKASFADQIRLASDFDKPLIVHCRDAFADVFEMIESSEAGPSTVLHCWTGGRKWTRRFLDLGVTFSFAGPVAFETGETIRLGAELVPPERTLVETDTPYLAPPPHRGEQNEPAWVEYNGAALAQVWGMELDDVATVTSENAMRVFRS